MKPTPEPQNDQTLDRVLRQWTMDAPLPPRFQEHVWQRIALTEAEPKPTLWTRLIRLVDVVLPQPKVAWSYLVTLLIAGVAAGEVAAQIKSSHLDAALSARYVHSLNPYQADQSDPSHP